MWLSLVKDKEVFWRRDDQINNTDLPLTIRNFRAVLSFLTVNRTKKYADAAFVWKIASLPLSFDFSRYVDILFKILNVIGLAR